MEIKNALLTISNYNRPGTKRTRTTAIACHYIGNPGTSAQANRNYFESLSTIGPQKEAKGESPTKASCHFIIGLLGEIFQLIPEDEISWCTNQANSYTISIEACHPDSSGKFNAATYAAYVELCADLCVRWDLDPLAGGLIRHYDVTGKPCPKYFVDNAAAWEQFKRDVAAAVAGKANKSGWHEEDGGWRYYNGDTGLCICNNWAKDPDDGKWYWFDGAGMMVCNVWYMHNNHWYYLGTDGAMLKGLQDINGKWYYLDQGGKMATEAVVLTPDDNGALQYPGIDK